MVMVKPAVLEQIDLLMEWRERVLREVFSVLQDQNIDVLLAENRRYYEISLKSDEHAACFAYDGNQIIGCGGVCYYDEMPSPENSAGKCAYLMNIYVQPECRNKGVGRQIIMWLVDQALHKGITKIYLETTDEARELYREIGFLPMAGYMKFDIRQCEKK